MDPRTHVARVLHNPKRMILAALLVASYLLGAVPFGVLIARTQGVDITAVGSGNIGATNTLRALGKKAGLIVFALDLLKGMIPAMAAGAIFGSKEAAGLAGTFAILGHCLSPFLSFKGGKGISTGLGVLFGTSPWVGLGAFVVFSVALGVWRYVSLASLMACASLVFFGYAAADPWPILAGYVLFAVFAVYRHSGNIQRLRSGTEPKFSWNRKGQTP